MKKSISFVFTNCPHGNAAGREGLDALLATYAFSDEIVLFFIADGVFLLLPKQQPEHILARDFISTFGILQIYGIDRLYFCADSAHERGLNANERLILDVEWLPAKDLRKKLSYYDRIITF